MPSPEALEAAHLIDRLERLARSGEQSAGLNPAQWEALRYLARANHFSRTPAALADYLASTRGTVSQTLIALEEKGYIERARSSQDRRAVDLQLTEKGWEFVRQDPLCCIEEAATGLADGCRKQVADGLELVVAALQRANGHARFGPCHGCEHLRHDPGPTSSCRCALTGDALAPADLGKICVDYAGPA